jgi:hypothetical protein
VRIAIVMILCAACGSPALDVARPTAQDAAPLHTQPDLTPLSDQRWDSLTGSSWSHLRRTSSTDDTVVRDESAPASPPYVLQIVFTPDMLKDHEPSVHWLGLPRVREVYAAWWIKLSANWTASPAGAGKMTFLHTWPDGEGQVYTALFGSAPPHRVSANTEWLPYGQKVWDPNVAATPVGYDRWYRVEWYVKWASDPGKPDGILRWWIDGALNGDFTTVEFPRGAIGFQQFEFAPTLQNPPPVTQHMYIDHTLLSVR